MTTLDYWKETLSDAAQECGLTMNGEQLTCLAEAAQGAHENYGMAFYSPPASDRIADIERGWKAKLEKAEASAELYRGGRNSQPHRAHF